MRRPFHPAPGGNSATPSSPDSGTFLRSPSTIDASSTRVQIPSAWAGSSGFAHRDRHYIVNACLSLTPLFYLYTRSKTENLAAAQLKSLRTAVSVIKKEYIP